MAVSRKAALSLFLLASVACSAQGKREHRQGHHHGVSNPPPALVERPEAPPPPPATSQLPPTAPQVSYRNGLLTVVANNSTLGDILSAVQAKTGASIDYPVSQTQDRVVASYGPASATQVLASLLNGSRFDYILLGSPGRPDLLSRVILTSKQSGATGVSSVSAAPPLSAKPAPPQPADDDSDTSADDTAVEQPVEQPPQPSPQPPPQIAPAQGQVAQPGQPKTPEQLLQELQRLQQQQNQPQGSSPLQPPASPPEQ